MMHYIIRCDCGTDIKGADKDEVVTQGIEHAREGHALTVTRDQMLQHVEVETE
jgi:predicted small metal-binding protein